MGPTAEVDVVIVGAGLSGLRTATLLEEAGLSCKVLEAKDRVGGKTLSLSASHQGGKVDVGAAWINDTNQSEMYKLAKQFGFDLIVQRATGTVIYQGKGGKVISYPYGERIEGSVEDPTRVLKFMETMSEHVDRSNLEHPEEGPDAAELDAMTLKEYALKYMGEDAVPLCDALAQGLLGAEGEEVSALFFIDYVKSGTGLANMISDEKDGGQYMRNRQGNQTFSLKLASMLKSDTLRLETPVTKIQQLDYDRNLVHVSNGDSFACKRVVVSVSTPLYTSIAFEPALPDTKTILSDSTALGYTSKVIFVFEKPWWREAGLSGSCSSTIGPIMLTFDTCSEEDQQFSITCFLVGDSGRIWSKYSKAERRKRVHQHFNLLFGSVDTVEQVPQPLNIIEQEWTKDPWFRGAPSPVMGPRVMSSDAGKAIREPFGNVHFVGTETALVWKGYMEGAVRSGMRGAEEVIDSLKGKN